MKAWRKVFNRLKDSAQIGRAKIISDFKDVDVAILKAARRSESLPREQRIQKILAAASSTQPRSDAAHCVHKLARRLSKTHSWTVALKILIIIHRTLRNGDQTFREELMNYVHERHLFHSLKFTSCSSPLARECSSWVQAYANFLEERLNCFNALKFDVETEQLIEPSSGAEKAFSRMRKMPCDELLKKLPSLQLLLFSLNCCRPEISAYRNQLIEYALALLLKESHRIYCAISDGLINLVDLFFEMSSNDAMRAVCIYRKACLQAEHLSSFYELAKNLEFCCNFQFPDLKKPPTSFLRIMEEYIEQGPPERILSEVEQGLCNPKPLPTQMKTSVFLPPSTVDGPEEEKTPNPVEEWELALFSTSSPKNGNLTSAKLVGKFDLLILDDLYDEVSSMASSTNPLFISLSSQTTPNLL